MTLFSMKKTFLFYLILLFAVVDGYSEKINDEEYEFCVMDDGIIRDFWVNQNFTDFKVFKTSSPAWTVQNGAKILVGNELGASSFFAQVVFTQPHYGSSWSVKHTYQVQWKNGSWYPGVTIIFVRVNKPSGVKLKNVPETMYIDSKETLGHELLGTYTPFSGGGYFDVVYGSSDPTIAQVQSGKIIAKKPGKVTISVTVRARNRNYTDTSYLIGTDSVEMEVIDYPVPTEINLNAQQLELNVGETNALEATYSPDNARTTITWKSMNERVATVVDGKITGIGRGKTVIKATTSNGLTAQCNVTVLGDEDYRHQRIGALNYDLNRQDMTAKVVHEIDLDNLEEEPDLDECNYIAGNVTVPSSVTFHGKEYKVTELGMGAFFCCGISSIQLPNTLTTIQPSAFENSSLKNIEIPESVTSIGSYCFAISKINDIYLPDKLKIIPEGCFYGVKGMEDIKLPKCLEEIQIGAFCETGLESIYIPESVKIIADGAFLRNNNLKAIYVDSRNRNFRVYNENLYTYDYKKLICTLNYLKELKIHNAMEEIAGYASYGGDKIETLHLPENVKVIGIGAFSMCSNLKDVTFNKNLEIIKEGAFYDCSLLTQLTFPVSLTEIEDYAFDSCSNVKSISFGSELETIGEYSFYDVSPDVIHISAVFPPEIEENTFSDYNSTLIVPKGRVASYSRAKGWKNFINITDEEDDAVDSIFADNEGEPEMVYDINGLYVSGSAENLAPGIYIVRRGSNVKKITVK